MRTRGIHFVSVLGIASLLGACSMLNIGQDSYSCTGIPEGVRCLSARQVYEQTHNGQRPQTIREQSSDATRSSNKVQLNAVARPKADTPSISASHPVSASVLSHLRSLPLRTPSQVMRIWIAPWIDEQGDLMTPSYVYTEIEPRRWTIGLPEVGTRPLLRPLISSQPVVSENPNEKTP